MTVVVGESLGFERWSPDFCSSGLPNPIWTRMRVGEVEVCNSLEGADWAENPVQVEICDHCGAPGCQSGGYVHVSKVENFVLWTRPQVADLGGVRDLAAWAIARFGSLAFPERIWQHITSVARNVPSQAQLPEADGRVLEDAWIAGRGRAMGTAEVLPWLEARLVGADTLDRVTALRTVGHWLNWFKQREGSSMGDVHLRYAEDCGAELETMYFDGPREEDWTGLARYRGSYIPAFGARLVMVPESLSQLPG